MFFCHRPLGSKTVIPVWKCTIYITKDNKLKVLNSVITIYFDFTIKSTMHSTLIQIHLPFSLLQMSCSPPSLPKSYLWPTYCSSFQPPFPNLILPATKHLCENHIKKKLQYVKQKSEICCAYMQKTVRAIKKCTQ